MIGAIPNPTKSLTVDFTLLKLKEAILYITELNGDYKLTASNEVFNQYTFEASEFLSFGVFIDINLSVVSDATTNIKIEVRRKIGAFDQSNEVTQANSHIENIISLITKALTLTETQKDAIKEKYKPVEGSIDKLPDTTNFNCGICKKKFYANNTLSRQAICPHCKKVNALPAPIQVRPIGEQIYKAIVIVAIALVIWWIFK